LSKRIIISGKERILNPYKAFLMSFFITGIGEIYSGSPQRGIILALLRAVSALAVPFYSLTNIKDSYLTEIFFSLIFFFLVTLFSPFNSSYISLKKSKITVSRLNSAGFLTLFALCSIIITLSALAVFFSFFSVIRVNNNYPPIIEKGDIAVIKKIGNQFYRKGEMVILKDENLSFSRIAGLPDEKVSYSKGHFTVHGSELSHSIFTENELKKFSITDYDVISETGGGFKYPVVQNREQRDFDITLNNDEYFAVPDNRMQASGFIKVKSENIYGRMEGLLFSGKRYKFLIKPYLISE